MTSAAPHRESGRFNQNGSDQQERAHSAEAALALESLVTYQVCILAKMFDRVSAAELSRACKLGVAEWRVLAQLAVHSPSTVRWLAARLRVDRAEVSRAAAALIARKLVRRAPDPADARSVLFSITENGEALYCRVMPDRVALHTRLMSALDPAEARMLVSAVAKLTRFLDRDETVVSAPLASRAALAKAAGSAARRKAIGAKAGKTRGRKR